MNAFKIIALIAAIAAGIAALAWQRGLIGRRVEVPATASLPPELKMPALAQFTDKQREQAEQLGRGICQAIKDDDAKTLENLLSTDMLFDRVLHGFEMPGGRRGQLESGAMQGISKRRGGIFAEILGGAAKFLRLRDINGQGAAWLRLQLPDGSFTIACALPDFRGPRARVADLYLLSTGTFTSENMRDMLIPMLGSGPANTGILVDGLEKISEARMRGDFEQVARVIRELPEEHRNRPVMRMLYLQALMSREDMSEYEVELMRIQREEPSNVTTSFKLMDLHVLKAEWSEAAEAALRVDEAAGGDAYVRSMAGMCLAYAGKLDEAEKAFVTARAMDPELAEVLVFRIHLCCARKDYADAVRTIEELEEKFRFEPDLTGMAPMYPALREFMESPEFKSWKEKP